jgi:hypothetical protein
MPSPSKSTKQSLAVAAPALKDLDSFFRERAEDISSAYAEAANAQRTLVWFGLLLTDTKERGKQTGIIPHGQFVKWLEANCPTVSVRTCQNWMQIAEGVTARFKNATAAFLVDGKEIPLHQVLHLPSTVLDKKAIEVREEIFSQVDGKSQRQLLLEFREGSDEPAPTGGFRPNRDELNDWLAKHGHENLVGKPFTKLPAKVQDAFHKYRTGKPKPVDPKKELRQRYSLLIEQAHETIAKLELFTDEALTELGEAGAELGKEIPEFKTIVSDLLASSTRMNVRIRDLTKGKSK